MPQTEPQVSALPPIPCTNAEALFGAYADMVYRLALLRTKSAPDADDVLQDVFLRCLRAKPEWRDASHQKAWFLKVTINCTKTLLTSAWRRHNAGEPNDLPDARTAEMIRNTEVYESVLALPKQYRTVVHLFYYEGYKTREIAELLGMRENTVKSHLFRARDMLRQELNEEVRDV